MSLYTNTNQGHNYRVFDRVTFLTLHLRSDWFPPLWLASLKKGSVVIEGYKQQLKYTVPGIPPELRKCSRFLFISRFRVRTERQENAKVVTKCD